MTAILEDAFEDDSAIKVGYRAVWLAKNPKRWFKIADIHSY